VEEESSVEFWDVPSWSISNTLRVGSVLDLSISNFGQRMATSPHRYGISMWNIEDPVSMVFRNPTAFTSAITMAQFSPDGSLLATAHYDGSTRIWNAFDGTLIRTMRADSVVESLAFSPDGSLLATSSSFDDYLVRIWRVDNGELLRTLVGHSVGVDHLLFSPFGDMLVSGSHDGQIIIWGIRP
jgi:WD40 repeat protein